MMKMPKSDPAARRELEHMLLREVQQRIQLARPDLSASAIKDGLYKQGHADQAALMTWADRCLGCADRGEPLPWESGAAEQPSAPRRAVKLTDRQAEQFDSALRAVVAALDVVRPQVADLLEQAAGATERERAEGLPAASHSYLAAAADHLRSARLMLNVVAQRGEDETE